ncbi:MAG: hypothetical protein AB1921_12610 [Thermodesulfobacteriota bacterium]
MPILSTTGTPSGKPPPATVRPPRLIRAFQPGRDPESPLVLLLNGKNAGTGQSAYQTIAESGGGRYLHVDGGLILSPPEGAETNSRTPAHMEMRFPVRVKTGWIVLLAAALAWAITAARGRPPSSRRRPLRLPLALGAAGALLLAVNLYGLGKPLRSPHILLGNDFVYDHDPELWDPDNALPLLVRKPGQDAEAYARQATQAVTKAMAYTWPESEKDAYGMRVPVWENYFLHLLSLFSREYSHYEFFNHRKALERGVGLCGQQAACLVGFLREAGLDARMAVLDGHVIATAPVAPGKWILLDPSFGVVIPESLDEARKDLCATAGYYGKHWPLLPDDLGRSPLVPACPRCIVLAAYGRKRADIDGQGMDGYFPHRRMEKAAYALKWPFPVALLAAALALAVIRKERARGKNPRGGSQPPRTQGGIP